MKKMLSIFLCVVMLIVMIPSCFASAAVLPAQQPAAVVVAADDSGTGQVDNSLAGFDEMIAQFIELWGGLLKVIVGSEVWSDFIPALVSVLSSISFPEIFKTLTQLWHDITG